MDPVILYYTMDQVSSIEINGVSVSVPYGTVVKVRTNSWARAVAPVAVPVYSGPEHALSSNEVEMILDGNKVHAIKSLRERTGLGLRESKAICDHYPDKLNKSS